MITKFGFLILLIILAVDYCDGIRCYECTHGMSAQGTVEPNCGEKFDEDGLEMVDCAGACYKVFSNSASGLGILRGCETHPIQNTDTCVNGDNAQGEGASCVCFTDLCNTGNNMAANSYSLVLAFSIVTAFLLQWRR